MARIRVLLAVVTVLLMPPASFSSADGAPETQVIPDLDHAQVTLPWSEIKDLMDKVNELEGETADQEDQAPRPFLLSSASYEGEVSAEWSEFKAELEIDLLEDLWHVIPVLGRSASIVSASIDGRTARIFLDDQKGHCLVARGTGRKTLRLRFLLPQGSSEGNSVLRLDLAGFAQNSLQLRIPLEKLDVNLSPAGKTRVTEQKGVTLVNAVFPLTRRLDIDWTRALPKREVMEEHRQTRCSIAQLVTVGGGLMKTNAFLSFSILHGKVDHFQLELPSDTTLLDVAGNDVGQYRIEAKEGRSLVKVFMARPVTGDVQLYVSAEKALNGTSAVASTPDIRMLDVDRESGVIAVMVTTNLEVSARKHENLTPVEVNELPSQLRQAAQHPILLSYKYLEHPYELILEITRHEDLRVLASTIDGAWVTSFQSAGGKIFHSAFFEVKNTHKQFLKIALPETCEIIGAFVADQRVKPAKDGDDNILIPLKKSAAGKTEQEPFVVEFMYIEDNRRMGWFGNRSASTLAVDIPISIFRWTLHLPDSYSYWGFEGNLAEARAWEYTQRDNSESSLSAIRRLKGAEQQARGSGRGRLGSLPIRFNIARTGRGFAFQRELVTSADEPARMAYRFVGAGLTRTLRTMLSLAGIAAAILSAFVLIAIRKGQEGAIRLKTIRRVVLFMVVAVLYDSYIFGPSIPSIAAALIAAVIVVDAHITSRRPGKQEVTSEA